MSLPIYQTITLKSASLEDLGHILAAELNLKHPLVFNLKNLDFDAQRELIGLIENYFVSHNLSYSFPYPIYLVSDHEASISEMALVKRIEDLPKFFSQKETKMNLKESHLAGRNKLLQLEVRNSDAAANTNELHLYGKTHRQIYELEIERQFLKNILNKLNKAK